MKEPDDATPLDPDERDGLLFPHIDTRGELDQMEQVNIQQGLSWLHNKKLSNDDLLTDSFARQLHQKLFSDVWKWAGEYRRTEKSIGIAPEQISVQARLLMDDTRFWVENDTYPAKELALRFHHRLVKIHLFPNGNGRHSRIMADAILTKLLSTQPIEWGGRNLTKAGDIRMNYINALRQADREDYSALFELYT